MKTTNALKEAMVASQYFESIHDRMLLVGTRWITTEVAMTDLVTRHGGINPSYVMQLVN